MSLRGRIGMKMCCQFMGAMSALAAWTQADRRESFLDTTMILLSRSIDANISIMHDGSTALKYSVRFLYKKMKKSWDKVSARKARIRTAQVRTCGKRSTLLHSESNREVTFGTQSTVKKNYNYKPKLSQKKKKFRRITIDDESRIVKNQW